MMNKEDLIEKWKGVEVRNIEEMSKEDFPILLEPFEGVHTFEDE